MLELKRIVTFYGSIQALKGVDIKVPEGGIVVLLGANGAGKTTVLKAISGLIPLHSGEIKLEDISLNNLPPERIVSLKIIHVPEGRGIFPRFTVKENLRIGTYTRMDRDKVYEDWGKTLEYFPILRERKDQIASTLSGGEQQMLAIARALLSGPRLLMIDEPSLGLAPLMIKELIRILRIINREGITILLAEQNAKLGLILAGFGYVMETGKVVYEGESQALAESDLIRKSYLGM